MSFLNLGQKLRSAKPSRGAAQTHISELSDAKGYVSAMNDAFVSSSAQQKMAMEKINHLSKSLMKMEDTLKQLNQAKAKASEMTDRADMLEKQLSQKTTQANDLDKELSITSRQLKGLQDELLALRSETSVQADRAHDNQARYAKQEAEVAAMARTAESLEAQNTDLAGLNAMLQKDLSEALDSLSANQRSVVELQRYLEDARAKLKTKGASADAARLELAQLKTNYEANHQQFIQSQAELENAQYQAKVSKTEFEDRMRRKDEAALSLTSQITQLEAQLRINDSVKAQAEHDITELQHSLRLANTRAQQEETRGREKSIEADINAKNVMSIKADYDALNAKYMTALDDIAVLKKLSQVQKDKLMRYAAIDVAAALPPAAPQRKDAPAPAAPVKTAIANSPTSKNVTIFQSVKSAS